MTPFKLILCVVILTASGFVQANPAGKSAFWKGTPMDGLVEEMRSMCNDDSDAISCMKFKVMNFFDNILKKNTYKLSNDVEVRHNGYRKVNEQRGESGLLDTFENYVQSHDVTVDLPFAGTKFTISPKNINEDELNLNIKFPTEGRSSVEARKSKLKKIFIPILVFVLLKAMTLVPLALGVLGLKAWNALQLSFFAFIVSVSLAIFQLCKKIAADNHHPQISAHGPWDAGRDAGRNFAEGAFDAILNQQPNSVDGLQMAYNAYA